MSEDAVAQVHKDLVENLMWEELEKRMASGEQVFLEELYEYAHEKSKPIMLLAKKNLQIHKQSRQIEELKQEAFIDKATGLYNRNAFMTMFEAQIVEDARRHKRPLGVMFLDLNGLKEINDSKGHAEGDSYIAKTGNAIKENIRASDIAFRIGGDEFVILLTNTDLEGTSTKASDLAKKFSDQNIRIAIGAGQIDTRNNITTQNSLKDIDSAMYVSKTLSKTQNKNTVKTLGKPLKTSAA